MNNRDIIEQYKRQFMGNILPIFPKWKLCEVPDAHSWQKPVAKGNLIISGVEYNACKACLKNHQQL